ncbi:unnamed protein product [Brachionus calyciflorus]|uniref:Uncharacterized protein n=1 Tax=Brachionus calyciflorus TaxID=104777 RepID=A0A813MD01_9BILA|nr:unnamed protein product [Brachionus calyciflorus]
MNNTNQDLIITDKNFQLNLVDFLLESIKFDEINYQVYKNTSNQVLDMSPIIELIPDKIYILDILYALNGSQIVQEFLDLQAKASNKSLEFRNNIQGYLIANSSNKIIVFLKEIQVENSRLKDLSICFLEQILEPKADKSCWNDHVNPLVILLLRNYNFFQEINSNLADYLAQYQIDIFNKCLKNKAFVTCLLDNKFFNQYIQNTTLEDVLEIFSKIEFFSTQDLKSILNYFNFTNLIPRSNLYMINGCVCLTAQLIGSGLNKCIFNYPILLNKELISKVSEVSSFYSGLLPKPNYFDKVSVNLGRLSQLVDTITPIDIFLTTDLFKKFLECLRENFNSDNNFKICFEKNPAVLNYVIQNFTFTSNNFTINNFSNCFIQLSQQTKNSSQCLEAFPELNFVINTNYTNALNILNGYFDRNETNIYNFINGLIQNLDQIANLVMNDQLIGNVTVVTNKIINSTTTSMKNNSTKFFFNFYLFIFSYFLNFYF